MNTYNAVKSIPALSSTHCKWDVFDTNSKKVGFVVTLNNVTEAGAVAQYLREEMANAEGQKAVERLHP